MKHTSECVHKTLYISIEHIPDPKKNEELEFWLNSNAASSGGGWLITTHLAKYYDTRQDIPCEHLVLLLGVAVGYDCQYLHLCPGAPYVEGFEIFPR